MFLGHWAVGFGAKKAAPRVSLGTLFLAAQLADLLWPVLVLAGAETVEIRAGATPVNPLVFTRYPWSHSLVALLAWGGIFALAYRRIGKGTGRAAAVLFGVVLSHWLLDAASHGPDVPVGPAGPFVGLGLWRSLPATVAVEILLLAAGAALYVRATRPRDRTGTLALAGLVVFLVAAYLASVFGPPPPGARAVAIGALAMWLIVAWGYWVDRHRTVAGAGSGTGSA
jgi:membrane-bound metal-dependent hydrolase YbcI (DUF457 family)